MEFLQDLQHWIFFVAAIVVFFFVLNYFGGHFWE
jgi:hypothetical protein